MDEKTAMNVEFLRARLLSERIVSRTARQRSEVLAERVMELEKQLRIVNIQRKKAEKAAEEVLSILETQGITCMGGLTDSSTDQEDNQHREEEENQCILSKDIKEDEFLTPSRLDRSKACGGSSLSWKSHGSNLDSQQKQKTKMNRHRQNSNSITTMKSSRKLPGKSCRKIKRVGAGSSSEKELEKSPLVDTACGNGAISHPDDFDENHECLLEASESKMEEFSVDSTILCSDNRIRESKDVCENDDGMRRALEQQSQLIVQFQAMEKAQRDWEEKFNDTKKPILENPNQVNMAEDSIWSSENSKLVGFLPQHEHEGKPSAKHISLTDDKKTERCRNCEIADRRGDIETTAINTIEAVPEAVTSQPQKSPNLTRKVHPHEVLPGPVYEKPITVPPINSNLNPPRPGLLHTPVTDQLIPVTTKRSLGSVLQSLHRARISLSEELVRNPSSGQGFLAIPAPGNSPMKPTSSSKALDFPISSSVLFRLPSNSFPQPQFSGPSVYGSGLRLTATRPDLGFSEGKASNVGDGKDYTDQYRVQVRYPSGCIESESQVSGSKDYFDRHLTSSTSESSGNECPLYYPGLSMRNPPFYNEIRNSSSNVTAQAFWRRHSYGGDGTFSSFH